MSIRIVLARRVASLRAGLVLVLVMFSACATFAEDRDLSGFHLTVANDRLTGSGFVIADGLVATNSHVLRGREVGDRVSLMATGARARSAQGVVIAFSSRLDLALIRVVLKDARRVPDAPSIQSKRMGLIVVGTSARQRGSPLQSTGRLTSGLVHLRGYGSGFMARFAAIDQGFSGGPVFTEDGSFVGMLTAIRLSTMVGQTEREAFLISGAAIRAEVARMLPRTVQTTN